VLRLCAVCDVDHYHIVDASDAAAAAAAAVLLNDENINKYILLIQQTN
jgi:hypothetical protein